MAQRGRKKVFPRTIRAFCENCGKVGDKLEKTPHQKRKYFFCSRDCQLEYRKKVYAGEIETKRERDKKEGYHQRERDTFDDSKLGPMAPRRFVEDLPTKGRHPSPY